MYETRADAAQFFLRHLYLHHFRRFPHPRPSPHANRLHALCGAAGPHTSALQALPTRRHCSHTCLLWFSLPHPRDAGAMCPCSGRVSVRVICPSRAARCSASRYTSRPCALARVSNPVAHATVQVPSAAQPSSRGAFAAPLLFGRGAARRAAHSTAHHAKLRHTARAPPPPHAHAHARARDLSVRFAQCAHPRSSCRAAPRLHAALPSRARTLSHTATCARPLAPAPPIPAPTAVLQPPCALHHATQRHPAAPPLVPLCACSPSVPLPRRYPPGTRARAPHAAPHPSARPTTMSDPAPAHAHAPAAGQPAGPWPGQPGCSLAARLVPAAGVQAPPRAAGAGRRWWWW